MFWQEPDGSSISAQRLLLITHPSGSFDYVASWDENTVDLIYMGAETWGSEGGANGDVAENRRHPLVSDTEGPRGSASWEKPPAPSNGQGLDLTTAASSA